MESGANEWSGGKGWRGEVDSDWDGKGAGTGWGKGGGGWHGRGEGGWKGHAEGWRPESGKDGGKGWKDCKGK